MKPEVSKRTPLKKNKKVHFRIWLVMTMFTVLLLTIIVTAWAVRHALSKGPRLSETQAKYITAIAEFPSLARQSIIQLKESISSDSVRMLINRKEVEKPHWIRHFPAPEDTGYLLFSGLDPVVKHSLVKLIRISDGKEMARWDPDWAVIKVQSAYNKYFPNSPTMLANHPLLLNNGDVILNNMYGILIRLSPCQSQPVWVLSKVSHHSIEIDAHGDIWTPSVSDEAFLDNPWLHDNLRDDSLARISTAGKLLENRSFSKILLNNGLRELLLGTAGETFREDPIHLNQISVAHGDSRYWKKGDLLISARNLSSVFLYRPSTGKIIWHQQGPWMGQHSARFVDDHRISVFNNNIFVGGPGKKLFVKPDDINQVLIYDFDTKKVTQPFQSLLAEAKPIAPYGSRAQILPDGGLFIEETNFGRHLRFTKDRLLWSRINDYNAEYIGAVSWSRYLTADEAKLPLRALEIRKCVESSDLKIKSKSSHMP